MASGLKKYQKRLDCQGRKKKGNKQEHNIKQQQSRLPLAVQQILYIYGYAIGQRKAEGNGNRKEKGKDKEPLQKIVFYLLVSKGQNGTADTEPCQGDADDKI